jgi:DNA-binding response OmpR family regulator
MSPATPEAQPPLRRTPYVLIAEDDYAFRRLLAAAFRRWGYGVLEAKDGLELGALLESQLFDQNRAPSIDLVVSDIRMPGRSGLFALAELRERNWTTPVVLMSAFGDAAAHAEALRLGAHLIDKPFALERLHSLVGGLEPSN